MSRCVTFAVPATLTIPTPRNTAFATIVAVDVPLDAKPSPGWWQAH